MLLIGNEFKDKAEVTISYEDRGYYFGDGVYEVFRVYGGQIYELDAHMERLQKSSKLIKIELPYTLENIKTNLKQLVKENQLDEGTIYLQVTRGCAPRSHQFPQPSVPNLMAYTTTVKRPKHLMDNGIACILLEDIRWLNCHIKSLNLLANVLAKQEAVERQAFEAILHRNGWVTEGSSSNVMAVKNGALYTHPADNLILHGITRAVVLQLAHQLDIEMKEEKFNTEFLENADEIFITGTTVEITPVIKLDSHLIGNGLPGPLTRQLQSAFEQTISF